jgi:hypothetical protein
MENIPGCGSPKSGEIVGVRVGICRSQYSTTARVYTVEDLTLEQTQRKLGSEHGAHGLIQILDVHCPGCDLIYKEV